MRYSALAGALLWASLTGCAAPHLYERHALVLDGPGLADYRIRYDEPGDCLWRQRWPSAYTVDRGPYQLAISAPIRFPGEPLLLNLELRGDGPPVAQISGALVADAPLELGNLRRYRLRPPADHGVVRVAVLRDGRQIGGEELAFHDEQCNALLWRAPGS